MKHLLKHNGLDPNKNLVSFKSSFPFYREGSKGSEIIQIVGRHIGSKRWNES